MRTEHQVNMNCITKAVRKLHVPISVILYFNILVILSFANGVQITTPQGDIIGTTKKSLNGRDIFLFLGIPYAKPPIGDLRFENPIPFGSWEGVKNAIEEGSTCLQQVPNWSTGGFQSASGSEDCLYLNVYTPSISDSKKLPVMVFIHGGGFAIGSSSSIYYNPSYLLDKDVVLVAMNYRLGPFGFASTEDAEMSGNWGLKDQALALRWVQENIAAYGGNPNSITIFGQSSGGVSVHYHTISPLSKGLFHRAIVMSGTAHCGGGNKLPGEIKIRTEMLASYVDCPTNSSDLLVKCLKKVPSERFIQANSYFRAIYGKGKLIIFTPVVEPKGVEGTFITENPSSVKSSVPMIFGATKDDGSFIVRGQLSAYSSLERFLAEYDENFKKIASEGLQFDSAGDNTTELMKEVQKFYFGKKKIDSTVIQDLFNMHTDCLFIQCTTSAIRSHEGLAYLYLFSYYSNKAPHKKEEVDYGVMHGAELAYLFPLAGKDRDNTENDWKMKDIMVSLWTNFAIYSNPNSNDSNIIWDPVSAPDMNYLNINGTDTSMVKNLFPERDNFWQHALNNNSSSGNKFFHNLTEGNTLTSLNTLKTSDKVLMQYKRAHEL